MLQLSKIKQQKVSSLNHCPIDTEAFSRKYQDGKVGLSARLSQETCLSYRKTNKSPGVRRFKY